MLRIRNFPAGATGVGWARITNESKILAALFGLLLVAVTSVAVRAQTSNGTPNWDNGACHENGIYFPARPGPMCVSADKAVSASTMPPPYPIISSGSATGAYLNTTITNSVRSCDEGWTLVDTGGRIMCARELREPK